MRSHHSGGTYLETQEPYGLFVGGRALCPDGKVRKLKRIATTADTFFSIPAAVAVRGRTATGYVTVNTQTDVVVFIPYEYRRNADAFDSPASDEPAPPQSSTSASNEAAPE